MTQLRIKELLGRANLILDKGIHLLPGFVMVKSAEMEAIQRDERIIMDEKNEAEKILSESELLSQVQREAEKIKTQVLSECQELREKTIEEAKQIKVQAEDEALRTKEGAQNYAEQILNNIDGDLAQLQTIVKNGQLYLEKLKTSGSATYNQPQQ